MTTTILITGATGHVGGQAVLRARAEGAHVRALVRSPERARLPEDVELVTGDLTHPETVAAAAKGADGVLLVWPFGTSRGAAEVIDALAPAGRLAYLSSLGVDDTTDRQADPITQFHADLERLVRAAGRPATFLRPSGFATNLLGWAETIRTQDVVRAPFPRASRSLIDERDIADAAVASLLGPSDDPGDDVVTHLLSGPSALTVVEQVEAIAQGIGRPVRYEEVPEELARQGLAEAFGDESVAAAIIAAHRHFATVPETVTTGVPDLLGRPARDLADWASFHAADFTP